MDDLGLPLFSETSIQLHSIWSVSWPFNDISLLEMTLQASIVGYMVLLEVRHFQKQRNHTVMAATGETLPLKVAFFRLKWRQTEYMFSFHMTPPIRNAALCKWYKIYCNSEVILSFSGWSCWWDTNCLSPIMGQDSQNLFSCFRRRMPGAYCTYSKSRVPHCAPLNEHVPTWLETDFVIVFHRFQWWIFHPLC